MLPRQPDTIQSAQKPNAAFPLPDDALHIDPD